MCIFVLAWCWVFATFLSRETLNAIFFPNYRRTLRSYHSARLLLKIVTENCCPTSEICFLFLFWNLQRQFSDFSNIKTILSRKTLWKIENRTKRCVTNQVCVTFENRKPNVVDKRCVDFFSSWKYNTVCNIGLFQVARLVITQNAVV